MYEHGLQNVWFVIISENRKTTQLIVYQRECVQMKYKEMIKSVMC